MTDATMETRWTHYSQKGPSGAIGVHQVTNLAPPFLGVFCSYDRIENQCRCERSLILISLYR